MKKSLYLLPIRSILFILFFMFISVFFKIDINQTSKWWTLGLNIINVLTISIIWQNCKKNKVRFIDIFKSNKKESIKEILLVALVIAILALVGMNITAFLIYHEIPYTPQCIFQSIPLWLAVINLFILPITTTIAEEGLYLGIGVNNIENKYKAIIIPLFFYLLQHIFFPFLLDFKFMIFRFFSFLFMMLFICTYYKKTKNMKPIILGHFITNFVTVIQIFSLSI